ncbi:hypothetical protein [Scopulibacillus cellulosilyticus]|uniref:Uncharacterized protein n=1 Tax=Scopulibacillus cellulosilyticus TaxID=2665665 RepID=A0ABW2Q3R0_9BACL
MTKHTTRELILNPTYREMADYYNTVVKLARVRTSKDKASVEGSVNIISTWNIAALRNTHCFSIDDLNEEVWMKLAEFNKRPFTGKKGCRLLAFEEEDKFALSPFPTTPYKMSDEKQRKYVLTITSLLKACFILFDMNISIDK